MNRSTLTSFFAIVLIFGSVSLISSETVVHKPDVNDAECVLCEFIMDELEKMIGSNATEEEIRSALEKVCSMLPITLRAECNILVEDYADEIIDLLLQEFSPSEICTAIKLCSSSNSRKSITLPGSQCELCKLIMGKLASMLTSNATEEEIEAALDEVCSLLPTTVEAECDEFVKKYAPMIIHLLAEEVAPEAICALIGLCSTNKVPSQPLKAPQVDDDDYCALCEFIMREVDSMLSENSTKAEIEAALMTVCSLLPATLRSECDGFIQAYIPTLIDLLVKDVSPDEICTLLKFCSTKFILKQEVAKSKSMQISDDTCILCEYIMREVDLLLTEKATEDEITKVVQKICTILPGTLTEQCTSFLNTYGDSLIQLLVQQLDPKDVCTVIKACPNTNKISAAKSSGGFVKTNPELCPFCEMIMAQLEDLLSENSTEEDIRIALDKVCSLIPGKLSRSCLLFVNSYSSAIIQLLTQEFDPSQICTAIGFCTTTAAASDDECTMCQLLVKFAADFMENNNTIEEIEKALLDLCNLLPSELYSECVEFVTDYVTLLPDLIANLLDPLKVCQELGFCSQPKLDASLCGPTTWCASMENAKLSSFRECTMCRLLVKSADEFLEKDSTVEEIVKGLLDLCNKQPRYIQSQCVNFVNQFGTMLPSLIAKLLDPVKVCQELGYCSKPKLGASLCSRGPGTWCASMENAILCNAVTHCKRHVWN